MPNVTLALVGNKLDLEDDKQMPRVIPTEVRCCCLFVRHNPGQMGKALADEKGLLFMETSAKTSKNVRELFQHIGGCIARGGCAQLCMQQGICPRSSCPWRAPRTWRWARRRERSRPAASRRCA